jgi:hypothetical protein
LLVQLQDGCDTEQQAARHGIPSATAASIYRAAGAAHRKVPHVGRSRLR